MKNIYLLLLLFCLSINAQEVVLSFEMEDTNPGMIVNKEGLSFSNSKNGDLALVIVEDENTIAKLFDVNFKEIATVSVDYFKSSYSSIIGYTIDGNVYTIISTNNSKKKFALLNIDFDNQKSEIIEFEYVFTKEKYLESVLYNNQLFIVTSNRDNQLVLRKFTSENNSFQIIKSFNIPEKDINQNLLTKKLPYTSGQSGVTKIDNRVPNSIEKTASQNKLYQKENYIYLTIDGVKKSENTVLHKIDLEALTLTTILYDYPKGKINKFKRYNSFIIDDAILQLGCNSNEMKIVVKNLDGKLLKEYYFNKDQNINIKNSPLKQQGSALIPLVKRRDLEETSRFLRKASRGSIGVTMYRNGENYAAIIGGYKNIPKASGSVVSIPTLTVTSSGAIVHVYNPTFYAYSSYNQTKSVFFNTTFDQNFNYIKTEVKENIFERVDDFYNKIKRDTANDIFFHKGDIYIGYFDMRTNIYQLLKM